MNEKRIWTKIKDYQDIKFRFFEGIGKITINRPRYRNAFTPDTIKEMIDAMHICRENNEIAVVVITGEGDKAFCSGETRILKVTEDTLERMESPG